MRFGPTVGPVSDIQQRQHMKQFTHHVNVNPESRPSKYTHTHTHTCAKSDDSRLLVRRASSAAQPTGRPVTVGVVLGFEHEAARAAGGPARAADGARPHLDVVTPPGEHLARGRAQDLTAAWRVVFPCSHVGQLGQRALGVAVPVGFEVPVTCLYVAVRERVSKMPANAAVVALRTRATGPQLHGDRELVVVEVREVDVHPSRAQRGVANGARWWGRVGAGSRR